MSIVALLFSKDKKHKKNDLKLPPHVHIYAQTEVSKKVWVQKNAQSCLAPTKNSTSTCCIVKQSEFMNGMISIRILPTKNFLRWKNNCSWKICLGFQYTGKRVMSASRSNWHIFQTFSRSTTLYNYQINYCIKPKMLMAFNMQSHVSANLNASLNRPDRTGPSIWV